ncbi:MAG: GapR family DNA-binding domain-containing protein [Pseudomonadota bacterium]
MLQPTETALPPAFPAKPSPAPTQAAPRDHLRKKDAEERQEEEAMLDLYLHALGMAPPVA